MSQLHSTRQCLCLLFFDAQLASGERLFKILLQVVSKHSSESHRKPQAKLPLIKEPVLKSIVLKGGTGLLSH